MGSAKNQSNAARKARIEEMRRAERARERRNRILTIVASSVVVAGLVVGGVFVVQSQADKAEASDAKDKDDKVKTAGKLVADKDGLKTWKGTLGRTHVTEPVKYPVEPPVGGDHDRVWMNCNGDVYTKAVNNMNAVHSLEHGAVWVTYNSKAPKADVEALAAKVKQTPYTLMSPDDGQQDPIVLSAWGVQRTVTGAKDPNVGKFFETYVQGKQTPEPGAACTGGMSE
ncbi:MULTISPECIES: DUF3105 domain-containing protein [Streptomyces]|uniref:DUF3105 domain-containing protein n=1 Tax=Streptomyces chartreusis TaxID=1969 RepID=A0A7H8TIY8_STRCX|nr:MULTISPECIES: DUF3105 domain-containing protein [Streptomyces]MBT1091611.1 DUF3105 domain-containing protein [Streptomyces sp. Tu102]QKZ22010.1 DUF3105 domain-containing protein [Streptomyces chartreusis]RSN98479.1 hypothetical protein DMH26_18630 [Streptomyces sp. WAC 05379]